MNREVSVDLHTALWAVVYAARHLRRINDGGHDIAPGVAEGNLWAALDLLDDVVREEDPVE